MTLLAEVVRVLEDSGVSSEIRSVAISAVIGEDRLEAALKGEFLDTDDVDDMEVDARPPNQTYLTSIQVTGFRGVGPTSTLELTPGPGLTVIAGRNGSGKSSFADALEVLLTGDSLSWKDKSADWKAGWRNLHNGESARVGAKFVVEDQRSHTEMWRGWDEDAKDASDAKTIVQPIGDKRTDLDSIGWSNALDLYRPLLSHSELGVIADNPSTLFDALAGVLGVDELVDGAALLRRRRLDLQRSLKDAKKQLKEVVLPMLEESDDEKAQQAIQSLKTSKWELHEIERPFSSTSEGRGIPGVDPAFSA